MALKTNEDGVVIDATRLQTKQAPQEDAEIIPLDGDDSGNQF
jgi:hypothetical protein